MDKKLSFVIPVYNVERYLPQCLDSILSQATRDCEIILVDDGSLDGCGAICDRYAREYDIVQVIHKPNGGLASARNAGMEVAEGENTWPLWIPMIISNPVQFAGCFTGSLQNRQMSASWS